MYAVRFRFFFFFFFLFLFCFFHNFKITVLDVYLCYVILQKHIYTDSSRCIEQSKIDISG